MTNENHPAPAQSTTLAPPETPKRLSEFTGSIVARGERLIASFPQSHWDEQKRQNEQKAAREFRSERQILWDAVCSQRGRRYEGCRLENYVVSCEDQENALRAASGYADSVATRVNDGVNCVLFGPVGTGKDHLMMAIAYVATYEQGLTVTWENGVDLFAGMRDLIGNGGSEVEFAKRLIRPSILAISDPLPPQGELSDFQASLLFRIIDGRYSAMKPTWVTLNVKDGPEASRRLTPQIHDRLRHGAVSVACSWKSFRD